MLPRPVVKDVVLDQAAVAVVDRDPHLNVMGVSGQKTGRSDECILVSVRRRGRRTGHVGEVDRKTAVLVGCDERRHVCVNVVLSTALIVVRPSPRTGCADVHVALVNHNLAGRFPVNFAHVTGPATTRRTDTNIHSSATPSSAVTP